ncbi:MAG TPA: aromatic ring-hydroxylating dioxygenase subunit alpha [Gemmatimonadaceae bacterium]|nr:aromatic ring-hydroxylating dioxygenase subunit alpha [Gemmatimonadaceae bacterium]
MSAFVRTTDIPLGTSRSLPGAYYTSAELFAEERARIFARRWLCIAREASLEEPGDYLLYDVAGENVIVLRDGEGTPRAFYNVCRHRGTRLCEHARGTFSAGTIQCPYHAWTYALDGRLLGAPSAGELEDFRKEDYPLHGVALERWEGFLLLNLARAPEPLREAWAPLMERFARFNLPVLLPARTIEYEVRANWKLIVENYSECYHCAPVHPSLARVTPPTSGENDLVEGSATGGFMTLNAGFDSLTLSGRACGVPVGGLSAEDRRRIYYYAIFPNLFLSLHPDYVMTHTLWPLAADRTHVVCSWLFHPETLDTTTFDPDDGVAFWDMTNRQDWHICEQSQLGVGSRMYQPGPYSRRESLAARFDLEVLRALGRPVPAARERPSAP